MKQTEHFTHNIPPVYDADSHILILGSFPSAASRAEAFYYAHPQNRFWRLISALYAQPCPASVGQKRDMLLRLRIALWDVAAACEVAGSSDASIRSVVPNDIGRILNACDIRAIFTNGGTATALYRKLVRPALARDCVSLPSTSPANARCTMDALLHSWSVITQL